MTRSTVVAHIEGPVEVGTIVDVPEGIRCVGNIAQEKDGRRFVLVLEEVITEESARALYPVLCPVCNLVFVYGVESDRFISENDLEHREERDKRFFVMPRPCDQCTDLCVDQTDSE